MSSLLVEVVRVGTVEAHPNADRLDITQVKGWQCIVGRGEFAPGDLAVFFPIDSILPDKLVDLYRLGFLKDSSQGARVRTVRLRGAISQGLLVPWTPLASSPDFTIPVPREGQDLGARLGVKKWEPAESAYQGGGKARATRHRPNPEFTRYCDPENIKNFPEAFSPDDWVVITEKIHGTNFRAGWVPRHYKGFWGGLKRRLFGRLLGDYEWCVGSRNVHLAFGNPRFYARDHYHRIAAKLDLKTLVPKGYTVYGEIFGPGVQDLTYGRTEADVLFLDVKKGGQYLDAGNARSFFAWYGLPMVPVLYEGRFDGVDAKALSSGQSKIHAGTIREGCVVKATEEANTSRSIGRKILKAVNEEYLLRKGGTEFH